jgi:hypothetical protein
MRSNKELFIEKSVIKHGDKYDYSLVEYINNKTKVKIICTEHGIFEQNPNNHINGQNCPECAKILKNNKQYSNLDNFIECAKNIHGDKYDYSLVEYVRAIKKVKIICRDHGVFEQQPNNHLSGQNCPECGKIVKSKKLRLDFEEFIEKAKNIHGDKYDYSLVEYVTTSHKVKIICKKHNYCFESNSANHLSGSGCPKCKLSRGVVQICNILDYNSIKYEIEKTIDGCVSDKNCKLKFDLYLNDRNIYVEYDGEQHFREVSVWGGEEGLRQRIKRDSIKDDFCKRNNIKLFRISYLDNIEEKIKEII